MPDDEHWLGRHSIQRRFVMHLDAFQLLNYKSFRDSGSVPLAADFNVVVGKNNAGKTSIVEALSSRLVERPHRSVHTIPVPGRAPAGGSRCRLGIYVTPAEVATEADDDAHTLHVPLHSIDSTAIRDVMETLDRFVAVGGKLSALVAPTADDSLGPILEALPSGAARWDGDATIEVRRPGPGASFEQVAVRRGGVPPAATLYGRLAERFRGKVVTLAAERGIGLAETTAALRLGARRQLTRNAQNLADVVHDLRADSSHLFGELLQGFRRVFPDIVDLTTLGDNTKPDLRLWPVARREDLAIPLRESGTGMSHVLAILVIVLTSETPRLIVIDEPQAFLHPGAVRALLEVFAEHPEHQYVITTHSSAALTAIGHAEILRVTKEQGESRVQALTGSEREKLEAVLSSIDARLSDVFGADRILWVEGPTEERCFRLLAREALRIPLADTLIRAVVHTGDFDSRQTRTVFEIYKRLSETTALLPTAVGFILDREGRSAAQQADWEAASNGKIRFLARRLYENYLLHPAAIAAMVNHLDSEFQKAAGNALVLEADVRAWLSTHGQDPQFFPSGNAVRYGDVGWATTVHGAKVLQHVCAQFAPGRIDYSGNKVEFGTWLTKWLLVNMPNELYEIVELLRKILSE